MRLFPEASNPLNSKELNKKYQDLEALEQEHYKAIEELKKQPIYNQLAKDFKISEEAQLKEEIFIDPALFNEWENPKNRHKLKVPIEVGELMKEVELEEEDKTISFNKNWVSHIKKENNSKLPSIDSLEKESKADSNDDSNPFESQHINKLLINDKLSLGNRMFILDTLLENSQLHLTKEYNRKYFYGLRKPTLNLLATKNNQLEPTKPKAKGRGKTKLAQFNTTAANTSNTSNVKLLPSNTLLYKINFYHSCRKPNKKFQEFLVPGCLPLFKLRDAFQCVEDFLTYPDPDQEDKIRAEEIKRKSEMESNNNNNNNNDNGNRLNKVAEDSKVRIKRSAKSDKVKDNSNSKVKRQRPSSSTAKPKPILTPLYGSPPSVHHMERRFHFNTLAEKISPSYFFLGTDLYADMRTTDSNDYTAPVIRFLNRLNEFEKRGTIIQEHQPKVFDMNVLLDEIELRQDQPYLFVHQGNCSHIVIIREIRCFNKEVDEISLDKYPKCLFRARDKEFNCHGCNIAQPQLILKEDIHAGDLILPLCNDCYDKWILDEDGKPLREAFCYPVMWECPY